MRVLLISPDKELAQDIRLCLQVRWTGLSLVCAPEQRKAIHVVHSERPDIIIIDLDSVGQNGFATLTQIRQFSDVPIIVLSQSSDVMDKVRALEMGADDWLTKPFVPMELLAKMNALLRRCGIIDFLQNIPPTFLSDRLTINFGTCEVYVSGRPVALTPTEYKVLSHLVHNEGKVVTHRSLLEAVWGPGYITDITFIKKYIYRLRSKLEDDPHHPRMLVGQRGFGYRFVQASHSRS